MARRAIGEASWTASARSQARASVSRPRRHSPGRRRTVRTVARSRRGARRRSCRAAPSRPRRAATSASFQARLCASWMPAFMPSPPAGEIVCAASPGQQHAAGAEGAGEPVVQLEVRRVGDLADADRRGHVLVEHPLQALGRGRAPPPSSSKMTCAASRRGRADPLVRLVEAGTGSSGRASRRPARSYPPRGGRLAALEGDTEHLAQRAVGAVAGYHPLRSHALSCPVVGLERDRRGVGVLFERDHGAPPLDAGARAARPAASTRSVSCCGTATVDGSSLAIPSKPSTPRQRVRGGRPCPRRRCPRRGARRPGRRGPAARASRACSSVARDWGDGAGQAVDAPGRCPVARQLDGQADHRPGADDQHRDRRLARARRRHTFPMLGWAPPPCRHLA